MCVFWVEGMWVSVTEYSAQCSSHYRSLSVTFLPPPPLWQSGRIPHSPPDSPVTAVAGIPDLVMKGAKRAAPSRPSPQDNIMRFWQAGKDRGFPNREELEHSSTVEPAHEIEVR